MKKEQKMTWCMGSQCRGPLVFSCAAVLTATLIQSVSAQEVIADAAELLPEIIIEGTTLSVSKDIKPEKNVYSGPSQTIGTPSQTTVDADEVNGDVAGANVDFDGDAAANEVAGQLLRNQGTSVTVVTSAELKAQQVRHAADALRSLPGVSVSRSGGFGGLTQVRIRGAEANHTLVLIDGIEVNSPTDGEFDFSDLAAGDIERIEVLRGPQSGLHGSNAVGGVISITTKGGKGPLTFQARAEGGSFDTTDGSVRVSAGNNRGHFSVGYHRRNTDGFNVAPLGNEDDGSMLSTFHLKAGLRLLQGIDLDFVVRNTKKTGDFDDFGGNPGVFATAFDAPNTFDSNLFVAGGKLTWEMFSGALTHVARFNYADTERGTVDSFGTSSNDGKTISFNYAATYKLNQPAFFNARHYLTGFVEHETQTFIPGADFIERERALFAQALEYRGEFSDRLFVSAVVRHDDHDTFDDFTTWRTTATLKIPELGLRPHASYGTGVKLPTMFETFGFIPAFFTPNPDLKPEETRGWDAGVELTLFSGAAVFDVTYFDMDLRNEIRTVGFPSTPVNLAGQSERQGVEVSSVFRLAENLAAGLSYTFTDSRDANGVRETRRPRHAARADVTYGFDNNKGKINLSAIYNGEMDDIAFQNPFFFPSSTIVLDEYVLLNVAASYQVSPGIELFGRVENILDEDYQEVFGFEGAPVAAFAGVRFTYVEEQSRAWAEGR